MKLNKIILMLIFLVICLVAHAQKSAEIKLVFDSNGKQKGSVLVQLSKDVLSEGSNLELYKSLVLSDIAEEKKEDIFRILLSKKAEWDIISETNKNGNIQSGTYHVNSKEKNRKNEFLLIRNKNSQLTIIYVEGNFAPQYLEKELKKLKDLFIYVNNKRIKIK